MICHPGSGSAEIFGGGPALVVLLKLVVVIMIVIVMIIIEVATHVKMYTNCTGIEKETNSTCAFWPHDRVR